MKCPACKYEHGWDADTLAKIGGECGDFWYLSNGVSAQRLEPYDFGPIVRSINFCPKCGIGFIETPYDREHTQ